MTEIKQKVSTIISIVIKFIVIISAMVGLYLNYFHGYGLEGQTFLYFTVQSIIWIAITDAILIGFQIKSIVDRTYMIPNWLNKLHMVFVVNITLTGIVFCCFLLPAALVLDPILTEGFNPCSFGAMLLHAFIPSITIFDFFFFTRRAWFKKRDVLWTYIPLVGYYLMTLVGYYQGWNFGKGYDGEKYEFIDLEFGYRNFPYPFLYYDSPVGWFGFNAKNFPFNLGSFYWVILIIIFFFVLGFCFILLSRFLIRRYNRVYNMEPIPGAPKKISEDFKNTVFDSIIDPKDDEETTNKSNNEKV